MKTVKGIEMISCCGKEMSSEVKFCSNCGKDLIKSSRSRKKQIALKKSETNISKSNFKSRKDLFIALSKDWKFMLSIVLLSFCVIALLNQLFPRTMQSKLDRQEWYLSVDDENIRIDFDGDSATLKGNYVGDNLNADVTYREDSIILFTSEDHLDSETLVFDEKLNKNYYRGHFAKDGQIFILRNFN